MDPTPTIAPTSAGTSKNDSDSEESAEMTMPIFHQVC